METTTTTEDAAQTATTAVAAAAELDEELEAMMGELKLKKKKKKKTVGTAEETATGDASTSATDATNDAANGNPIGNSNSAAAAAATGATDAVVTESISRTNTTSPVNGLSSREEKQIYGILLARVYESLRANNPDLVNKKKSVLRPPQVQRVGTSRLLWSNFAEICRMMKRDPDHVFRYFLAELGTTGSIDANERFLMKGKFVPKYIESLLKKYITEYVTCPECKGVETQLIRDANTRMYVMKCDSCGANKTVAPIQKGFHAVSKGERRAARNAE